MSSCGLLFVFIYSSAAVFMIVGSQSTTDNDQDDVSIVEQLIHTVATLRANQAMLQVKIEKLEARQPSATPGNRCFSSNCLWCCIRHILLSVNKITFRGERGDMWPAAGCAIVKVKK